MDILNDSKRPSPEAQQLAQGRTLVPYWGYNPQGKLVPMCRWAVLKGGETLPQAFKRLSVKRPEPAWTPELWAKAQRLLAQIFGQREQHRQP